MNEPKDLARWCEAASDAPAELREWLNAAREDLPGPAALAALGLATPPLPPPSPPFSGPEAAATATGASALATLGVGKVLAIVAVVAGGAAFFALSTEPAAPVKPKPAPSVTESVVVAETPPPAPSAEAPLPEPLASVVPSAVSTQLAPTGNVNEVGLLRQARGALAQQPQRALELLRRHQREFPNSNYEQEREVIRIEALRRLGKTEEAERLGEAFERKFPDSAHKNRLDRGTP